MSHIMEPVVESIGYAARSIKGRQHLANVAEGGIIKQTGCPNCFWGLTRVV